MVNDEHSLDKRLLVLKRDGESLQLPARKYLAGLAPKDIPSNEYLSFRVDRYEEENGELWLRYESGVYDAKSFEISTEVNSEALLAYEIKKVCIINQYSNQYVTRKSFNSDINLDQRLNATKPAYDQPSITSLEKKPTSNLESIIQEIKIPVKEMHFDDGKVTFFAFINSKIRLRKFEIENPFLKKEFDAIKNYFAKAFNTKKFLVRINIECVGSEIVNQIATSDIIAQIDDSLLEQVENQILEDEFLLNEDDIIVPSVVLQNIANILGAEVQNTEWLLNKLVTLNKTKHYYHLRFLSSKQASGIMNLRMTGKPLSFIFLIESQNNYYMVWETYKTEEATYIWKIAGMSQYELKSEVEKLMDKIRWLRKSHKLNYINSKPENFKRIEHDYGGEDNGFKKWKEQLERFMGS